MQQGQFVQYKTKFFQEDTHGFCGAAAVQISKIGYKIGVLTYRECVTRCSTSIFFMIRTHKGPDKQAKIFSNSESTAPNFFKKLRDVYPTAALRCTSHRWVKLHGVHHCRVWLHCVHPTYQVSVLIRNFTNAISLWYLKILEWKSNCKSKIVVGTFFTLDVFF